jgi:hypothetical protein
MSTNSLNIVHVLNKINDDIEVGRFKGIKVEEHLCEICNTNSVEDEKHYLMQCETYTEQRPTLFDCVTNKQNMTDEDLFIELLTNHHKAVSKFLYNAWNKRKNMLYEKTGQ